MTSKRRNRFLILTCFVAAIVLVVVLSWNREPRYEGRTLSEWTIRLSKSSSDSEAIHAIRTISTNALPYLVEWIQYEPPNARNKLVAFLNWVRLKMPGVHTMSVDKEARRSFGAMLALRALGAEAAPVAGELGRIASSSKMASDDPDVRVVAVRATLALTSLGEAAVPPLVSALTNKQNLVPHVAAEAIGELGTNAFPAIPTLIQSLNHTNDRVVWRAMESLGKLRLQPSFAVPALVKELDNPDPFLRSCAAEALGQFEAESLSAIPALTQALEDEDSEVRNAATNAILRIAPEVLTNAPTE